MTSDGRPQDAIVVGIDDIPSARGVIRWAAREAMLHGVSLVVCHAYPHLGWPAESATEDANRRLAGEIAHAGVAAAREAAPEVDALPYAAEGDLRKVLLEAAERPRLLVVGSRGRGSVTALLLGSAGVDLAGHSPCPVAVVRESVQTGQRLFAGNVVVGVDCANTSRAAVAFAFAEAARRGVPLVAVHAGLFGAVDAWRDETFGELHEERPDDGWELLEVAVEPHRGLYPLVQVKLALRDAIPAAKGLLSAAEGAAVLIVGSTGYSRVGGALGESISRTAVTQAPCPVIVVPATVTLPIVSAGMAAHDDPVFLLDHDALLRGVPARPEANCQGARTAADLVERSW